MPNMSRKTIHSVHSEDSSFADFAHKETNTEAYLRQQQEYRPRQLFNNNHEYETRKKVSYTYSQWLRIRRTLVTVITSFVSMCHFFLRVQTSWFAKLHQFTSRVMLLDTWLLWKNGNSNKTAKLMALCLVPLLLLGGWYILTNLGAIFYATYFNSSSIAIPPPETIIHHPPSMLIDPPTDKMAEENPKLSDEQLKVITDSLKTSMSDRDRYNVEEIVASVMQSSGFQEIVQKLDAAPSINNQQTIIDTLVEELHKLKEHMAQLDKNRLEDLHTISQLKAQNLQNTAHLSYHLTKCCRRPIINVESYVKKLLSDILNDADFLRNQKGFNNYLQAVFAAKQDLEAKLSNLTAHLSSKFDSAIEESSFKLMEEVSKKVTSFIKSSSYSLASGSDNSSFSDERAREIVRRVLKIYDADKTGLVDYAMETMGGQVLSTRCTETYHYGKAVVSVLGIPLWYPVNSPRTIITPSINPGECWAFQNFPGFVVLRLSKKVQVEAFSLEHISRLLVPNGDIDSAPKEFQVFGLKDEEDKEPLLLGEYVFDVEGEPLQFFEVQNGGGVFEIVELRVLSNNGNPNYTCLYRFRVHGKCIT
ncbi:unnamed protein product [Phaedon cochleariae]|uniref:SUN domain-containing protein n=1 Tax=Phaedon cochleariae TaxID=80249 RepID=A0A9P0DHX1_PHACE|nr:unnamed protein product [Phaedon cochleariae]